MSAPVIHWCLCGCHCAPDDASEAAAFYGVPMLDAVETYAACDVCRNDHWRRIYAATEPDAPAPTDKAPWVDPPSSQADGWKGE